MWTPDIGKEVVTLRLRTGQEESFIAKSQYDPTHI
jgi:hypothetical protein